MADLKDRLIKADENYWTTLKIYEGTLPQVFAGDDETREAMLARSGRFPDSDNDPELEAAIDRCLAHREAERVLWEVEREVAEVAKLAGFVVGRPLDHDDFTQEAEHREAA